MPFRLSFWPSHYFLLFSQEHLKNHPKTVLKHISQHSNTKCANVISQEVGLQGRRYNMGSRKRTMENYKNKQIVNNICLFLFSYNIDLKNNNINLLQPHCCIALS